MSSFRCNRTEGTELGICMVRESDGRFPCGAAGRCPDGQSCDGSYCCKDSACAGGSDTTACGDGKVEGSEQCDDAGESADCDTDCTPVECGDGTTNPTAGESCDDGNTDDRDGCSASCHYEPGDGWTSIPGGSFMMGGTEWPDEQPIHDVTVPTFEMMATEVTVADYQACEDAGKCTAPDTGTPCNWGEVSRKDHPVNCVDWYQADAYCAWVGGRLPSEAEWEYAARSGGRDITYPWGDETATCGYAVMSYGSRGCGKNSTWSVCSIPAGNSAQGLCDMAGNVMEWVQDRDHNSYDGAPVDGSAWEAGGGSNRVLRGGSWYYDAVYLRADARARHVAPSRRTIYVGFRCARPVVREKAISPSIAKACEARPSSR